VINQGVHAPDQPVAISLVVRDDFESANVDEAS
jgi:hypothetical protein